MIGLQVENRYGKSLMIYAFNIWVLKMQKGSNTNRYHCIDRPVGVQRIVLHNVSVNIATRIEQKMNRY